MIESRDESIHSPTRHAEVSSHPDEASTAIDHRSMVPEGEASLGDTDYCIREEVGRGGMGIVYRAYETSLDRDVALKFLSNKYAPDSVAATRFVEEARITGRLQHPGIPPIHRIGTLPDGRPYLAMKLIRGRTLSEVIAEGSIEPLAVFEGIAQAVGFAHASGIVHRDLKPQNVMVGRHGEVQVMDWGLAKSIGAGRAAEESVGSSGETTNSERCETPIRHPDTPLTRYGSALGTPAYMSPEQAAGELDKIDARSDVFGLGAILCVMLTGQPPYVGSSPESVRISAMRGELGGAIARLDGCRGDPEIIALCKYCLAVDRDLRPKNGAAVAEAAAAIRRTASERAERAEREKLAAEVKAKEQAKRRRAVQWAAALIAGVLVLGIAGTSFGLWRAEEARKREAELRLEAEAQERAAKAAKAQAEAAAKEEAAQRTIAEQQTIVAKRQTAIAEEQRKKAIAAEIETHDQFAKSTDQLMELMLGSRVLGPAERLYLAGVRERWTDFADRAASEPEAKLRRCLALFRTAYLRQKLGERREAAIDYLACAESAKDLLAAGSKSISARKFLANATSNLALLASEENRKAEARPGYEEAIRMRAELLEEFPDDYENWREQANTHRNLAQLLRDIGERTESRKQYESAISHYERSLKLNPGSATIASELGRTQNHLGALFIELKKFDLAATYLEASLKSQESIVEKNPDVPEYLSELARSRGNYAVLLMQKKDPKNSAMQFEKALATQDRLVANFPSIARYRVDQARFAMNLAVQLESLGDVKRAVAIAKKALAIQEELVKLDPGVVQYRIELAANVLNFGSTELNSGRAAESVPYYDRAIELLRAVLKEDARLAKAKEYLEMSLSSRADAHLKLKKYTAAVADWDEAIPLVPAEFKPQYRLARLGPLVRSGKVEAAATEAERLIKERKNWNGDALAELAAIFAIAGGSNADGAEKYRERAMAVLEEAVAAGFLNAARLNDGDDFASLIGRDDFRELAAKIAKKPKK